MEYVALALSALLLLLCTASGHIHSPDGEVNYRTALSLSRLQGYAVEPLPDGFLTRAGADGREYPQYGPLQPLLSVPLVWLGDLLAPAIPPDWLRFQEERLGSTVSMYRSMESRWSGFPGFYPADHSERVRRIFFMLFNPIVAWATVLLLASWARSFPGFGRFWPLLPAAYLLATYAWPHSRPAFTESLAAFFLLLSAWFAWRSARTESDRSLHLHAVGVGAAAACAVLTRLDSAVALPGLLLIAVGSFLHSDRPGGRKVFALAIGATAFLLLASWLPIQNHLRYGAFFVSGYEDAAEGIQFNIPILHALWIYLLSPGKGIFWYSPPLLAALLAWGIFFKRDRFLALGFGCIILAFLFIIGKWQNLGGWCWGPRHLFQVTPFLLFPFPFLLSGELPEPLRRPARLILLSTLLLGFLVQFSGVLVDFMWPLDKSLRTMPTQQQTEAILSLEYYGPLLHLRTWRLDRDPDWLLVDLWRSGEPGAQILAASVWLLFLAMLFGSIRTLIQRTGGLDSESNPGDNPSESRSN